jgi:hypothetical protein
MLKKCKYFVGKIKLTRCLLRHVTLPQSAFLSHKHCNFHLCKFFVFRYVVNLCVTFIFPRPIRVFVLIWKEEWKILPVYQLRHCPLEGCKFAVSLLMQESALSKAFYIKQEFCCCCCCCCETYLNFVGKEIFRLLCFLKFL